MKCRTYSIFVILTLFLLLLNAGCKKEDDTVQDADGNSYHTVTIGTQTWMVENLRTKTYNDGTPIVNITGQTEWAFMTNPGYCNYNNDESNVSKYGRLYNWYAIETGKLAPKGWHVPSKEEWEVLINYLIANGYNYDGTTTGNKIAKSLGDSKYWGISDYEGSLGSTGHPELNNKTHFNALPSGARGWEFEVLGYVGHLWTSTSSTDLSNNAAYRVWIDNITPSITTQYTSRYIGLAVRCLKN
jgi:uncharacterized protein (TIGR02145 family)